MGTNKGLTYRRQFILGCNYVEKLENWKRTPLKNGLNLTSHPDLELTQVECNGIELTLLGFFIDPYNPKRSNQDNLECILDGANSFDDVLKNTYSYSGRWVIIYNDPKESKVFNDPCGMRQVYYTIKDKKIWCGSQPNILADVLNYKQDTDSNLVEFISSPNFEKEEKSWFGEGTLFREIKHLMPNKYLNLNNKTTKRYWIDEESTLSLDETVVSVCEILKGSLIAIEERYNPMLAVTAGWDSRVLLAASKSIKENVHYFVSTMNTLNPEHMDIKIPNTLLNKLGLKLNVISNISPLRKEFKDVLEKNVSMARDLPKTLTIQHHYDYLGDKININGNASEIARMYYGEYHPENINTVYLADISGYSSCKYVIHSLEKWYLEAKEVSKDHNIDIMDLFYWEQRMGNWGTMYQAEQDIAIEEFCPFNNRKLLMQLLKVDKKYRRSPDYKIYQKIIRNLWEETLSEPINPVNLKGKVKRVIIKIMPESMKRNLKSLVKSLKK
ncbi:TPA: hypothetical protein QCU24_003962 [Bacillus cereus]|nr:hypothetical protein [Bacillus cereus]